jgi:biotin carboxyl carrier protein
MVKITISVFLILTQVFAIEIINPGTLQVKTTQPKKSSSIPMGKYLGTYSYPLTHRYTLSANVDGFITVINIKPYIHVKKGDVLFVIKSPKLLDLQSEYISTMLEEEYFLKEVTRLKPLAKKGVVATKRLIESQNKLEKIHASASFQQDVLLAYGMSDKQLKYIKSYHKPDPTIKIIAPVSGNIASMDVQKGTFVSQGKMLAILIDTSECHFKIEMPWRIADTLKLGEKIFAKDKVFTLFAASPLINAVSQTRDLDMHEQGECNQKGGASINIALSREHDAWKIPVSAVVGYEDSSIIFVKRSNGFEPLHVKVLSRYNANSYVEASLKESDEIAVSSVLTLKSIMESESE